MKNSLKRPRRAGGDSVARICDIPDCGQRHDARGLCNKHYLAARRARTGPCAVDGCTQNTLARGLCHMHYSRLRKTGQVGPVESLLESNIGRICVVDDCDEPAKCKGFCRSHMGRFVSRGISYDDFRELLKKQGGRCAICCRRDEVLKIDHDHAHCDSANGCKECVRGLLCGRCNTALGKFGDDPVILLRALAYLEEYANG